MKFDLNLIMQQYRLQPRDVENALFPHVRYKNMALARVLNGEALLNTDQVQALADLAGVMVQDLFLYKNDWRARAEKGTLIFIKNEYEAKLNGALLSVYKDNNLAEQRAINTSVKLEDLINEIETIINNLNNK